MAKLNYAPTKSNLLALKRQLSFAEEGYDLLDQKRQVLSLELMSRLEGVQSAQKAVAQALERAFSALREALLDLGSEALDAAVLASRVQHSIELDGHHIAGIKLPRVRAQADPPGLQFGLGGTSAHTDLAMERFVELLPLLARLAELETAALRLARELRKTHRRCNALEKLFIPNYRETIHYIADTLEEREREAFVILKMIHDRVTSTG